MNSDITYLIDTTGTVIDSISSVYKPGLSVYYLNDGNILRSIRKTYLAPLGAGGGVQKISLGGSLLWDYNYYTEDYLSHHDIEPMPNGNILAIIREFISTEEQIALGKNPILATNELKSEKIIEFKPIGTSEIEIIWEWSFADHLIQDYDETKSNYGDVANHPELIDFNYEVQPLEGKFPLPVLGPMSLLKESHLNHQGKLMFKWVYWNMLLKGYRIPLGPDMSMIGKKTI